MSNGQTSAKNDNYGFTGSSEQVKNFIKLNVKSNINQRALGLPATPLNIRGIAGIGKTAIVEQVAAEMGIGFKYVAVGQTEEVCDITGMPKVAVTMVKGGKRATVIESAVKLYTDAGWEIDTTVEPVTINLPPVWLPREGIDPEFGIILLDDLTRGNKTIQQALMQLLQKSEVNSSWKIPVGWVIVTTSNPDNGDYNVEELDEAQLQRLRHCNMEFDAENWAKWAEANNVDSRGINFVLAHKEVVGKGQRTSPRTLDSFFVLLKNFPDIKGNLMEVMQCAKSCVDNETADIFMSFVTKGMSNIISSEEILKGKFATTKKAIEKFIGSEGTPTRADVLYIICIRLFTYLTLNISTKKEEFTKEMKENFTSLLTLNNFPADLRFSLIQDLLDHGKKENKSIITNFINTSDELLGLIMEKI